MRCRLTRLSPELTVDASRRGWKRTANVTALGLGERAVQHRGRPQVFPAACWEQSLRGRPLGRRRPCATCRFDARSLWRVGSLERYSTLDQCREHSGGRNSLILNEQLVRFQEVIVQIQCVQS